jgi:hypothetical protein
MIGSGLDVAIKAARAGGASGVALFSADGMDDAKWSALRTTNAIPVKK